MNRAKLLGELALIQELLVALVEDLDDASYRAQYHPDLSPIGWHAGHCAIIEKYWLHNMMLNDAAVSEAEQYLYFPENMPKPQRGASLPDKDEHLKWVQTVQQESLALLGSPTAGFNAHKLATNHYIEYFLLQHHSQHYETMTMVLTQRALQLHQAGDYRPIQPLQPSEPVRQHNTIPAGHFKIGSNFSVQAYDNEVPPQTVQTCLAGIAPHMVTNTEYLLFMQEGGYDNREYWSDEGWQWRQQTQCAAPEHWRQSANDWYGVGLRGACDLLADAAVSGINLYEAQAYAEWLRLTRPDHFTDVRLPHEYESEIARRLNLIEDSGQAWEWCSNAFHPYPDYQPFPYDRYSKTWFDDCHFTLRGSSLYTRPVIRRASFRNFYNADKRHIFAGLRLAYGDQMLSMPPSTMSV